MCVHEMQVEKHGSGLRQKMKAVAIADDEDRQFGYLAKQSKSKYLVWFSLVKDGEETTEWQEVQKQNQIPAPKPTKLKKKGK